MDSVDQYLAEIAAAVRPLPARELALADAYGAVLAGDVTAQWPLPAFDNSAMDGYAVLRRVTSPGPAPARRSRCPWTARSRPATPAAAS